MDCDDVVREDGNSPGLTDELMEFDPVDQEEDEAKNASSTVMDESNINEEIPGNVMEESSVVEEVSSSVVMENNITKEIPSTIVDGSNVTEEVPSTVLDESNVTEVESSTVLDGSNGTEEIPESVLDESSMSEEIPNIQNEININNDIHNAVPEEQGQRINEINTESFAEAYDNQLEFDSTEADFSIPRNINESNNFTSSEEILKNCVWELGQLAWARMSIYPFWPCVITHEPSPFKIFKKVQAKGRSGNTLMIHVHFFNDHARHSWVPSHHMIPFRGIEDFRKRARLVTNAIRKKEPKFAAALTIKPNLFSTWQRAVAEAMDVFEELDMTPLEDFKIQEKITQNESNTLKRKLKSKDDSKARKSTDSNDNSKSSVNSEIENNLNLDTPPVSPKNTTKTDFRAAHFKKQRRIRKIINKLQPPDFEVFYERSYDSAIRQDPNATDDQVREYLSQVWDRMTDVEKLKYRGTYKIARDA